MRYVLVQNVQVGSTDVNFLVKDVQEFVIEDAIGATPYDDVLILTDGSDTMDALAGNDYVEGKGGSDILIGNAGNDILWGGNDKDMLLFADDITSNEKINMIYKPVTLSVTHFRYPLNNKNETMGMVA